MKRIKVDRIEIRLRGISAEVAQSIIPGLGHKLLEQIARQLGFMKGKGIIRISEIDAGTLQTPKATSSSALRPMIAGKIAESIDSKTRSVNEEG